MADIAHTAPPATAQQPVTDAVHGVDITDPYRWLEDSDSADTQAWTATQNTYTRAYLDGLPGRDAWRVRLQELAEVGGVSAIIRAGQRYFYTRREGTQSQPILYVRDGAHGQERMLIDPGTFSADNASALDWWYPSLDGALVAYGISQGGNERSTLAVMRTDDGSDTGESIPHTRYCSIAWLPDSTGFFYTRYPAPESVPAGEENYNIHLYRHTLGDDPADDPMLYADADPQAILGVDLSHDERWLILSVSHGWARNEVYLCDLSQPEYDWVSMTDGGEPALYGAQIVDDRLYIVTNEAAPRYKVMVADPAAPQHANWQEFVAEGTHTLDGFQSFGDGWVGHYLENATSRLRIFDSTGAQTGEIALPVVGSANLGSATAPHSDDLLIILTSFALPLTAYRYAAADSKLTPLITPPMPRGIDPAAIAVQQVWYTSKDGTRISMFIVQKAGHEATGRRPTILTGYGGFNISRTPQYFSAWLAWIERGGIYALPNLRGGGEYGEDWHRSGMLGNKQNVFDDFYSAAEYLVAEGYTDSNHLACYGGSNGGLLVGAAITQRPDLWRAAVCAVPLLDMIRYHQFQIARLWIPEYGSSENADEFAWLRAYSPYHNVTPGIVYPATLFTTAEGDTRVDPLHARKMAALLQAATAGDPTERPILLRLEGRAGHGVGKPLAKVLDESTDVYSFFAAQLRLV